MDYNFEKDEIKICLQLVKRYLGEKVMGKETFRLVDGLKTKLENYNRNSVKLTK